MCAATGEKIVNQGQLNEFTACTNSPMPQMMYCSAHMNNSEGVLEERLDTRRLTRSKEKDLGISLEELTTDLGCRKREAITMRTVRSKTAGMLYAIRTCGVAIGHMECIHAGSIQKFLVIIK